MKRLILITFLMVCCAVGGHAFGYRVTVRDIPSELVGQMLVFRDNGEGVLMERREIAGDSLVLAGEIDRAAYAMVYAGDRHAWFVLEPGDIVVSLDGSRPVEGGELNVGMTALLDTLERCSDPMPILRRAVADNPDDGIGEFALLSYGEACSPDEWDETCAVVSDRIRELYSVRECGRHKGVLRNTWTGMPFVDFEGRDAEGNSVRLSDYAGKGRYILVDFWASWCKSCIQEGRKYIKPLHEQYAGRDDFMVLGVGADNTADAAKANGFGWPQMMDCGMKPMGLYGFNALPHVLLIAPDGTIAARYLHGAGIDRAVSEALDSKKVSLLDEGTFVLRGSMSPRWGGVVRFAVSDPVKNRPHELKADRKGNFCMTVPMRGPREELYLYLGGTVTVPVCRGDTIDLVIGDRGFDISSPDSGANLDLILAMTLSERTSGKYRKFSDAVNRYRRDGCHDSASDPLYLESVRLLDEYVSACMNVTDTFVANHGEPRSMEYFRLRSEFRPLSILAWSPMVTYGFEGYEDRWLTYQSYRQFVLNYMQTHGADDDPSVRIAEWYGMAPSAYMADWLILKTLDMTARYDGPDRASRYVKEFYGLVSDPDIKEAVAAMAPEMARLAAGEPAPRLCLTDADGGTFSLDDFRGKYLYLDFWDFGCRPCIAEFAVMPALKEWLGPAADRIEFVTVCASRPSKRKLEKFAAKHSMTGRNLILDDDKSDSCYKTGVFPTYILIDPEGRIVEFNTDRPSEILRKATAGIPPAMEVVKGD